VSVQGAAAKGGSYPIERGRSRLSQILAEAAPDQKNPEMLAVTVRRDGKAGTVRLSDVYGDPQQDIALRPGDSIILSDVVENVTVLGATGAQGTIQIPKRDFTLIEALGEAKGLSPDTADPRAVFVLRSRPGVQAPPLVYQVDMRRPETIALANRFTLQPNDVVLVSNAPFAQTKQVLLSIAQAMASVRNAALAVP
jgi:polysaccharide export outer membrane protein